MKPGKKYLWFAFAFLHKRKTFWMSIVLKLVPLAGSRNPYLAKCEYNSLCTQGYECLRFQLFKGSLYSAYCLETPQQPKSHKCELGEFLPVPVLYSLFQ